MGFGSLFLHRGLKVLAACVLSALAACAPRQVRPQAPLPPRVTVEQATQLIPPEEKDREGWAEDVLAALEAHRLYPSAEAVCSVLAVIEQESGFEANPAVPGLARIVQQRLEAYADKLGPLGKPAVVMGLRSSSRVDLKRLLATCAAKYVFGNSVS